ncbi:membrane-associated protein [Streptomyces umbrinus]|uniref:Membrane-associated protein n=1 Tax=Streptomyces umbrinus TaxID=67370 RepID=A0ABU0STQ5_9ACTN|nr:DedA family protein [Streptomyces umbrinus]MDQ1026929.1 membrane-associated protein [Streptomyces umbrinus]
MTAWLAERVLAYGSVGIVALVLLVPALEAALPIVGALMPGQAAVVLGGLFAWHGHIAIETALLAALAGSVLGNVAGYAVGRRWQGRLSARAPAGTRRGRYTEQAVGLIERRGAGAVFVGRFTSVLRTLVPMLCGASGMPLRRYLLWSVLSSAVWAPAFVVIGYIMGPAGPG